MFHHYCYKFPCHNLQPRYPEMRLCSWISFLIWNMTVVEFWLAVTRQRLSIHVEHMAINPCDNFDFFLDKCISHLSAFKLQPIHGTDRVEYVITLNTDGLLSWHTYTYICMYISCHLKQHLRMLPSVFCSVQCFDMSTFFLWNNTLQPGGQEELQASHHVLDQCPDLAKHTMKILGSAW